MLEYIIVWLIGIILFLGGVIFGLAKFIYDMGW